MQESEHKEPIVLLIHGTFANLPEDEKSAKEKEEVEEKTFRQKLREAFGFDDTQSHKGRPDEGDSWWQIGENNFWGILKKKISPRGLALAGDTETLGKNPDNLDENGELKEHLRPFKWSSLNTERDRHKGGSIC